MAITATKFFTMDPCNLTSKTEDRFFTDIKTRNNTFKRTAADRFRSVDERCIEIFRRSGAAIKDVLDIGISSGTTTLALHEALRRAGFPARLTATDLSLRGYLLAAGPALRVLIDEGGHPLQYEVLGRAIRAWSRRADYVTGMGIVRSALRLATRRAIARHLAEPDPAARQVKLVSPRLDSNTEIEVEENDIFCPTENFIGRFDFIRAANILNTGYFDESELRRALTNVVAYLSGPGAWLLVARTKGQNTAGTLFRISQGGHSLIVADRFGAGSEIEQLVLATPVHRGTTGA